MGTPTPLDTKSAQKNKPRWNAMTYSFTALSISSFFLLFCILPFFLFPYANQGFNPLG